MTDPERDIEAVLDESGPDYEEFSYNRPTAGHQGEVFLVTLKYEGQEYEVVVKFKAGDPDFALEPFLHEYVADRTDVPVPRILVYEDSPKLDVDAYFVTERIHGSNLAERMTEIDEGMHESVIRHAGRILGDMHDEVGFEGFGRLALEDERLVVDELTWEWQTFFRELVNRYIDRLADTPFHELQEEARTNLERSVGVIENTDAPRLVHDDFRPANLLFVADDSEPISAVLDWQFALAADPEYHIARTDFLFIDPAFRDEQTRERLRSCLYEGYSEYREFEPDEGYERRRTVYHFATLLWRMVGFEASFADLSELARGRAEVRFKQQFRHLTESLPED